MVYITLTVFILSNGFAHVLLFESIKIVFVKQ